MKNQIQQDMKLKCSNLYIKKKNTEITAAKPQAFGDNSISKQESEAISNPRNVWCRVKNEEIEVGEPGYRREGDP